MKEAIGNINKYLSKNAGKATALRKSDLAGTVRELPCGVSVEYDPIGLPIFKVDSQLDIKILDEMKAAGKNINEMKSVEHMKEATKKLKNKIETDLTFEKHLKDLGLDSDAIDDIKI